MQAHKYSLIPKASSIEELIQKACGHSIPGHCETHSHRSIFLYSCSVVPALPLSNAYARENHATGRWVKERYGRLPRDGSAGFPGFGG
jgi:hypothetical protein